MKRGRMRQPTKAALLRARNIILGRDPEFSWRTEEMSPMPSTDAVVLGGIPLDNYEHPETYHTLVTKHLPHDATGADLDNAIAKLVFGYAEEIRAPYGSFSCGGGT